MRRLLPAAILVFLVCAGSATAAPRPQYAVYGEYAKSNVLMKNFLNRRVFNTVEAQSGRDIQLNADGSITLRPGTYRLTGYSITTLQATFAPPVATTTNYPGYAMVYKVADEDSPGQTLLDKALGIGSPQNGLDGTPSTFDAFFTARRTTKIAVGHQSGDDIEAAKELYLDVYSVAGVPSDFHVFARIAITKL